MLSLYLHKERMEGCIESTYLWNLFQLSSERRQAGMEAEAPSQLPGLMVPHPPLDADGVLD